MLTNQNQIHILIHKLIHIFHAYWYNVFAAKCNTNAWGEHSTQPLGELPTSINVWCPHKIGFQMPWRRKCRDGWTILELGKQFRHLIICCFSFSWRHFSSIREILLCIVGFHPLVFFTYTHCSIIVLSDLMLVICTSVPVAHFVCGREQNIYRLEIWSMYFVFSKNSWVCFKSNWLAWTNLQYICYPNPVFHSMWHFKSANVLNIFRF